MAERNKFNPNEGPIRVPGYDEVAADKGFKIIDTQFVVEEEGSIVFGVVTNRKPSDEGEELRVLWHPGGIIYETLTKRGFSIRDGESLKDFPLESVETSGPDLEGNYVTIISIKTK